MDPRPIFDPQTGAPSLGAAIDALPDELFQRLIASRRPVYTNPDGSICEGGDACTGDCLGEDTLALYGLDAGQPFDTGQLGAVLERFLRCDEDDCTADRAPGSDYCIDHQDDPPQPPTCPGIIGRVAGSAYYTRLCGLPIVRVEYGVGTCSAGHVERLPS